MALTRSTPVRIWFNRTFATNYWLMPMLRANPDGVKVEIYVTHSDPNSPVLQAADFAELDPKLDDASYVDWALDFCERNGIEIFLPRHRIELIAESEERFAALGVRVLASSSSALRLFENKGLTYTAARDSGVPVPPWRVASTAAGIELALESLRSELAPEDRVVIKPTVGVGAQGFRIIDDSRRSIGDLLSRDSTVSSEQLIEAYRGSEAAGEQLPELMLLPFLEEPELSVDCLSSPEGELLKLIPRAKLSRSRVFTEEYPAALELVERLYAGRGLRYITNTQLRWWRGELALLETNTRPAGGLYATELTGVNLIWDAVRLALFGEATELQPQLGASYVALESFRELNPLAQR